MSNFIGSLVTKVNTAPTIAAAPGRWTLSEAAKYIAKETWPYSISTDPYLNQTSILLSGDGVEGGQNNTFLSESGTPAAVGTYAGYFDGVGDYVNVADNAVLDLSGDFTIECWIYRIPRTGETFPRFLSKGNYQGGASEWIMSVDPSTGSLNFQYAVINQNIFIGTLTSYQWTHIAMSRSGTTIRTFLNGSLTTTTTLSLDFTSASPVRIGADEALNANEAWSGYISNVRIIKGTALYTAAFSVPTSPLTAVAGTGYSTSLLTCNSATFVDNSGNALTVTSVGNAAVATVSAPAITRTNNTTQGSFNPYGDRWSNYFDGTGDYLTTSSVTFSGDFTVEGWVFIVNLSAGRSLVQIGDDFNANGPIFYVTTGGKFSIYAGTTLLTGSATIEVNTWVHLAVCRSGSTIKSYVNGLLDATITNSTTFTGAVRIGAELYNGTLGGTIMNGYISDLRLVTGTPLYTSNFTPSTIPLTVVSDIGYSTSLLTCQSNRFKDSSTNNFTITKVGDVKVRPNSPYAPSKVYNPAHGASAYYDGTGDLLTIPASAVNAFTGNFTIGCWYYLVNTTFTGASLYVQNVNPYLAININTNGVNYDIYLNSATPTFTATATIQSGCWNYVALVRSGSTVTVYHNGVSVGSSTSSAVLGYSLSSNIQNMSAPSYISDFRIVNGVADSSVPTAPSTTTSNTVVLLNFKNANIYDATSKNTLETVNGAMTVTGRKKQGSGAMYFDGNGDYLAIPYNQDINITSGDFTVEGWIYFNSVSASQFIFANYSSTSWGIALFTNAAGTLNYFLSNTGSSWNIANGVLIGNVVVGQWYHFALVRSGSTFTPYLNGVVGTTTTSSSNLFNGSLPYTLGGIPTAGFSSFNGYIDDFRVSKIARYTAAFTPPIRAHGVV